MKTRILTAAIIICAVFAALAAFSADNRADAQSLQDKTFAHRMRPPVPFNHDVHNDRARIEDCGVCHHVYADGKRIEGEVSAGIPCAECHAPRNGKNPMALIRAYHLQCKGCHLERKAGPVLCGQCHPRK